MKKTILLLSAIIALSSCIKKDIGECPPEMIEVKAGSSVIHVVSRAPNEDIPAGAAVLATQTAGDYSSLYKDGFMSFASGAGSPVGFDNGPVYFPADGSTLYMAAFNPAFAWTFSATDAVIDYSGYEDVMVAPQVATTAAQAMAGDYPTMAFKHVMTQLLVKVQATAAVAALWGDITDISLVRAMGVNPKDKISVDIVSAVCSPDATSDDVDFVEFYGVTDGGTVDETFTDVRMLLTPAVPIPQTLTLIAYTLCIPVEATATDVEYVLLVKTTERTVGVEVNVNLMSLAAVDYVGTTQGYAFTINLNFLEPEVRAGSSVVPWEDMGGADVDVH